MNKIILTSILFLGIAGLTPNLLKATPAYGSYYNPGHGTSDYNASYDVSRNNISYGRVCTKSRNGRLSLRSGSGTGYRKIAEIPNQRYVPLYSGRYANDGFWWWNVNYNGYSGWVRADFVCEDPQ